MEAGSAQFSRKMTHRREDQDKLLFMMMHISGFSTQFCHQNHIAVGIDVSECADRATELIAQYEPESFQLVSAGAVDVVGLLL
jgi:hypothetical protein